MNQTENLKLNKYDLISDAKQPFSISDGLNANWDIIDENFKNLNNTSQSTQNDLQILEEKFTNKLDTIHVDYSKGVSITVQSYYCPADGVITGVMTAAQSENYWLQINGVNVLHQYGETNQRVTAPFCIPVKQNDLMYCYRIKNFVFYPYV